MANIEALIDEAKQLEIYSEELDTEAKLKSAINFKKLQVEAEELGIDTTGIETQKDLKEAIKAASKSSGKKIKVEFTKIPAGRFGLSHNIGDKAEFEKKQADEMIDAGYAKKV
ncbi:hypothetical protein [Mesoflavibacter profundi]|uniref:hypothetical protein n=1 Tax=Mesoflavibacter profundi TaxID=2708110 RepID=UPI0035152C50